MAETKKKSRKRRSDLGKKRGKRTKNPQFQRGSIDFRTIGTQQTFAPNLTRLAGLVSSSRPIVPYQPQMDLASMIQSEFKKFQDLQEHQLVVNERQAVPVGQEDENDYEEERRKAIDEATSARIANLRRQEEEATERAMEAETRALGAEDELRQKSSMVGELEAVGNALEIRNQTLQQEQRALKYQQEQQRIQSIFDKVNSMSVATLRTITGETGGDITDLRATALGMEGISKFKLNRKGKKMIFVPEFGELIPEVGEVEQAQEEGGMAQMDFLSTMLSREALMSAESEIQMEQKDLQLQGYQQALQAQQEELQARQQQEEEFYAMTAESLARIEAEKQQLQQDYAGLQGQTKAESLANETRLLELTRREEQLREQLTEEQSAKEALRSSQAEELAKRQQEQDKQSAMIARLQEDIDYKKAQMEEFKTSVSKKTYDEEIGRLQKQLSQQEAELKYAREQAAKADKLIVKQQLEKLELQQSLLSKNESQRPFTIQKGLAEDFKAEESFKPLVPLQSPKSSRTIVLPSSLPPSSPKTFIIQGQAVKVAASPKADVQQAQEEQPIVEIPKVEEKSLGPQVKRTGIKPRAAAIRPEQRQELMAEIKPEEVSLEVAAFSELKGIPESSIPGSGGGRPVPKIRLKQRLESRQAEAVEEVISNPINEREARERQVSKEMGWNKEHVEREIERRSRHGDLNDEQFRLYTMFGQVGVGREAAKRLVKGQSTQKSEILLEQLDKLSKTSSGILLGPSKILEILQNQSQAATEIIRPQVDDTRRAQEEVPVLVDLKGINSTSYGTSL